MLPSWTRFLLLVGVSSLIGVAQLATGGLLVVGSSRGLGCDEGEPEVQHYRGSCNSLPSQVDLQPKRADLTCVGYSVMDYRKAIGDLEAANGDCH